MYTTRRGTPLALAALISRTIIRFFTVSILERRDETCSLTLVSLRKYVQCTSTYWAGPGIENSLVVVSYDYVVNTLVMYAWLYVYHVCMSVSTWTLVSFSLSDSLTNAILVVLCTYVRNNRTRSILPHYPFLNVQGRVTIHLVTHTCTWSRTHAGNFVGGSSPGHTHPWRCGRRNMTILDLLVEKESKFGLWS